MTFAMVAAFGPLVSFMGLVFIYCLPREPTLRADGTIDRSVYQPLEAHIYTRRFVKRGALCGLLFGSIAGLIAFVVG